MPYFFPLQMLSVLELISFYEHRETKYSAASLGTFIKDRELDLLTHCTCKAILKLLV